MQPFETYKIDTDIKYTGPNTNTPCWLQNLLLKAPKHAIL